MGDPAGVGPEIVLRALLDPQLAEECQLFVFGDLSVLEAVAVRLESCLPSSLRVIAASEFAAMRNLETSERRHCLIDFAAISPEEFTPAAVHASCGAASFQYIQGSMDAAEAGKVHAVTTGPINKSALHAAGLDYPGHTEMFAERAETSKWCMMQYSEKVTCTFATVHCGYREVPDLLTQSRVLDTIQLTHDALFRIRGRTPQILVCGLNPHAGEGGLFGDSEEEERIRPAVEEAQAMGIQVEGPLPPDTVFIPERLAEADAIVCMYHDQGHIPVKALAFDQAVNTTLGLKMIRTSVDHGTAYDIAWQGKASASSLFAAIRLAVRLAVEPDDSPSLSRG